MFWKRKTPAGPLPIIVDAAITVSPEDFDRIKAMFPDNQVNVFGSDWRALTIPAATVGLAPKLAKLIESAQKRGIVPQ